MGSILTSRDQAGRLLYEKVLPYISMQGLTSARPAAGLSGRLYWSTDDEALFFDDGVDWQSVVSADAVSSVFGRVGAVAATLNDYAASLVDNDSSVTGDTVKDALQNVAGAIVVDHGGLTGLSDDDHTGYSLLAGRSGGQTLIGGSAASELLTLQSTSHATRGFVKSVDTLQLADATTAAKGLQFGDGAAGYDTFLYRLGAGVLGTTNKFSVVGNPITDTQAASTSNAFQTLVTGDTVPRLAVKASGLLEWGAGSASAADVNLYRQAANVLGTEDTLYQTAVTCRRSMGVGPQEYIGDYIKPTYAASATAIYGVFLDGTLVESNNYWRGLSTRISVPTGKTLSECYGFYCFDPTGAGTVTNNYGFYVPNMAKGTNNYGIYFAGTGTGNGINWGGTTNLYCASANVLKTDDAFQAASYAVGTTAGVDATVALYKLTSGGANGSMTITKGIVTAYTAPT